MAGAAQSRAAWQPARCAPGPEFPSVTSQFPTYFAAKSSGFVDGVFTDPGSAASPPLAHSLGLHAVAPKIWQARWRAFCTSWDG